MTDTAKHTPTPHLPGQLIAVGCRLWRDEERPRTLVADTKVPLIGRSMRYANAARIAKTWNMHDKLVALAKRAIAGCSCHATMQPGIKCLSCEARDLVREAEQS